jgi:hypothetical protein
VVLSTAGLRQASPVWALEELAVPAIREGIADGKIIPLRKRNGEDELVAQLTLLLGYAIESLQEGVPLTLSDLARQVRLPNPARVLGLLGTVRSWPWLLDRLRFMPSDQGVLGVGRSAMVLKGAPIARRGAAIFGVASRSWPQPVMKRLESLGLAPAYNHPSHSMATDCSAWLLEVADDWSLALRLVPMPEQTWFDPDSYDEELRPYVREVLEQIHGPYDTSNARIIRRQVVELLRHIAELQGDATGMVFESGCIQHGLKGKTTAFVGGDLGQVKAMEAEGAVAFLDLSRLPPDDPRAYGEVPYSPWSGRVSIGAGDCSFLITGRRGEFGSHEMAWAAQMAIASEDRPEHLRGIFRPVSEVALNASGEDLRGVRYVVGQALVGKRGASAAARERVGFLVRDYRGEVSSGWSIPWGDIHKPEVQAAAIARAESHLRRVAPDGTRPSLTCGRGECSRA